MSVETELPWEKLSPRAAFVSCQRQVSFKQSWINEWKGRQLQGKERVSATLAMRFVRACWGQQVLVMGNWEQVTAQHYKGNPLQKITSHTNFLTCSSISNISKNSLTPLSSLNSTRRPIYITHLCQKFSSLILRQSEDGSEAQLQHSNAILIKKQVRGFWVLPFKVQLAWALGTSGCLTLSLINLQNSTSLDMTSTVHDIPSSQMGDNPTELKAITYHQNLLIQVIL